VAGCTAERWRLCQQGEDETRRKDVLMSKKATTRSGAVLDEPVVAADMGLAAAPPDAADEDALVAPSVNAAAGTMKASGEAETNGVADSGDGDGLATAGGLDPVAAAAASGSADEGDDAGASDEEPPPLSPAERETLFRERTAAVEHRITDLTRREQEIVRERAALDVEAQTADQQVATVAAELAEMPARISAARAQLVAFQGASPQAEASAAAHLEAERQREQQLQAALAEGTRSGADTDSGSNVRYGLGLQTAETPVLHLPHRRACPSSGNRMIWWI
jgi:hypothetical protein